ncbi:hypothetical protein GRF29_69g1340653 [Pseudopithomyces chartarum]|uniref:Uncharacterized protein n=1 Tax=Pseudopithomyces chartarum TaxID=1892770 RepID=A0AAN6M1C3_9PLEO|nr:hypothetical protein GRF29_69g1340653 [Pseudopithomyces chartarum]
MRLINIFARALDAYAHYGATSATQALTSSGSLTATPSATSMPREARVPVPSFVRMDGTLIQIHDFNSHERAAFAMENDVPAWSAGPTGELTITPDAPETLDSISLHVKNVAAPGETPEGSAGAAASEAGGAPASTPPPWTMSATPVGYEGKGSVNPENFLPHWTVTAAQAGSVAPGSSPIGIEWNVPTTSFTLTAPPVESAGRGSPASTCAVGADEIFGMCSFSSTGTSITADTSDLLVPTTLSTVTVSGAETTESLGRVPMSKGELAQYGTMADLRPGTPPAFIVVVTFTVLWVAFFGWAVRKVWKEDEKEDEDRLKHSEWMGQEASDGQRSDKGKSSGRANS